MYLRTIRVILPALVLLLFPMKMQAQDGGASSGFTPYSIYGFGDLSRQGTAYNASIGGAGIGDRNENTINVLNPAAVTARPEKAFMFDFGVENRNVMFNGNAATAIGSQATGDLKSANNTFNVHHVMASMPIYKHSAFKLGIMPYSSVGYNFTAHEEDDHLIAEMGDISYKKIGEGTLYQVFLGAGVTLWDKLSLGVDGNYYFGNIERYSQAFFNTNSDYNNIYSGWSYVMSGFGAKFGLQYTQPLKRGKLTVGATYSLKTKIKGYETRYAYAGTDTVQYNKFNIDGYDIPSEIGAGISYRHGEKWAVNFDYIHQNWNGVEFEGNPGVDFKPAKRQGFHVGFECTPDRYDVRYFFRRWTYRIGAYREYSYFSLNGQQAASTGITFGFGVPIPVRLYNYVNVAVELGKRGTVKNNLIEEKYCMVHLSFSLNDIWFQKNLYY